MPRMPTIVLVLAAAAIAACSTVPERRHETDALDSALPAALAALDGARKGEGPYRLIGAQQLPIDSRWIWRMTFKAERHLPADLEHEMLTAGGEIFVNVDVATGETSVGYGE